jgi:hypothetical protein
MDWMTKNIPYSKSWLNRLSEVTRKSRFPIWSFYPTLFALYWALFGYGARRLAEVLPVGKWTNFEIFDISAGTIMVVSILAFYHYFEIEISNAIDESNALLNISSKKLSELKFKFVALPSAPFFIISIFFFLVGVGAGIDQYKLGDINLIHIPLLLDFGLGSMFLFSFAVRMGRFIFQIRNLFSEVITLDLFNLSSIYELPSLAAKAGLFYLVIFYPNLLPNLSTAIGNPIFFGVTGIASLLPLFAFVFPIGALSRQLLLQKKQEITRVSLQLKGAYEKVSVDFESNKLEEMEMTKATISNLNSHRQYLNNLSAWPWKQGTFRLTLTAVLLPIIVWIVQQILDRIIGF